jgi:hypothetical protein
VGLCVVIAKCGKEYELEHDEKPSNFQCECGGELNSRGVVSKTVKATKMYKIVMTANPQLNYNTNSMTVDVLDSNNNLITSGNIAWTPTEAISQKTKKYIQITGSPGTYSMAVSTNALQNWTVSIYDYY